MLEFVLAVHAADGKRFVVALPERGGLLIGREAPADVVVADTFLSRAHVRLECDGGLVNLHDADSRNGVLVNGVRAMQRVLRQGDCFVAGRSFFRLSAMIEGKVASPLLVGRPQTSLLPKQDPVAEALGGCAFAVLDGAVDSGVYEFLKSSGAFFQSLYEGKSASPIAPMGPFLLNLTGNPDLVQHLVQLGWEKAWGIFLKSTASFEQVRHHLRTLLLTKAEDGRTLLFRFYDPRVLAPFVETCGPAQRVELFGPVEAFLLSKERTGGPLWIMATGEQVPVS